MQNMNRQQIDRDKIDSLETGTTTLGLMTDSGVILAADNRASQGHLKASGRAQKVYQLDDHIGITIAGSVGDAQKILRMMRAEVNLYKIENKRITVKGASTLLSNILNASKMLPYFNQFIIGGVDSDSVLFDLDPLGGLMEKRKFTATGSGTPLAYGLLEDAYEEGLSMDEGVKLAVRAIQSASERDTASGDGIDVATITGDGYETLPDSDVEKHMK